MTPVKVGRYCIESPRFSLVLILLFYNSIFIWTNQRPEQLNDLTTCFVHGYCIHVYEINVLIHPFQGGNTGPTNVLSGMPQEGPIMCRRQRVF